MFLISSWVGEDLQHPVFFFFGGVRAKIYQNIRVISFVLNVFQDLICHLGVDLPITIYIMYLVGRAVIYNMVCKVHHQLQR